LNLVDSSAWLEYFADAPNARYFASAIEKPELLIVPTIVIYEVYKLVSLQRTADAALQAVSTLHQGTTVELTAELAVSAARISAHEKLPMADSIILASARAHDAIIWTQDSDFEGLPKVNFRARRG